MLWQINSFLTGTSELYIYNDDLAERFFGSVDTTIHATPLGLPHKAHGRGYWVAECRDQQDLDLWFLMAIVARQLVSWPKWPQCQRWTWVIICTNVFFSPRLKINSNIWETAKVSPTFFIFVSWSLVSESLQKWFSLAWCNSGRSFSEKWCEGHLSPNVFYWEYSVYRLANKTHFEKNWKLIMRRFVV